MEGHLIPSFTSPPPPLPSFSVQDRPEITLYTQVSSRFPLLPPPPSFSLPPALSDPPHKSGRRSPPPSTSPLPPLPFPFPYSFFSIVIPIFYLPSFFFFFLCPPLDIRFLSRIKESYSPSPPLFPSPRLLHLTGKPSPNHKDEGKTITFFFLSFFPLSFLFYWLIKGN